jgi:hypothetical protein
MTFTPKESSPWAPARPQRWRSSLNSCIILIMDGCAPWKTQAFLCFHRIHAPNITTGLKYVFLSLGTCCSSTVPQRVGHLALARLLKGESTLKQKNSSKSTSHKDVLGCFFILITKSAFLRVWEVSFYNLVCSPAPILDGQPLKFFAFRRAPRFS